MRKAFFGICIYVFLGLVSCQMESSDPFIRMEEAKRFSKDSFFKTAVESPLHPEKRKQFLNLDYFEPKKDYVVKAKFTEINPPQSIYIEVSDGMEDEYFRVGKLSFTLKGKQCTLSAFQNAKYINDTDKNHTLFVPFWDETNGKETYHTGRFLDVTLVDGMQETEIDFNDAYNPYCAYTEDYKCPLPPAENKLPMRVEAGEMLYDGI